MPFMHSCTVCINLTISAQKEQACATHNYVNRWNFIAALSTSSQRLSLSTYDHLELTGAKSSISDLVVHRPSFSHVPPSSIEPLGQFSSKKHKSSLGKAKIFYSETIRKQKASSLETAVTWLWRKHYTINQ
mgnify:CR=1 FL=1